MVVWAGFISWFSTDAFSAHSTNSYIDPVLRYLFGELTPAGFRLAHTVVRKSAHLTEYGVLAVLMCRAMTDGGTLTTAIVLRTIAACAAYAALDEFHQSFVPSRTSSPVDVLLDTTGATIATLTLAARRASKAARRAPPRAARARRGRSQ